jgi:hypothetical protein
MKVQIGEDVVWREVDDQIVILDTAKNHYFGLGGAGSAMWRLLAECGSTEAALEGLKNEFDADPAQLRDDLDKLVKDLVDRGLLQTIMDTPVTARQKRARR